VKSRVKDGDFQIQINIIIAVTVDLQDGMKINLIVVVKGVNNQQNIELRLSFVKSTIYLKVPDTSKVPCIGVTDEVFIGRKPMGYVFFHEIDEPLSLDKIRWELEIIFHKFRLPIFVKETGNGYHFVIFNIISSQTREELMDEFFERLPSDYKNARDDQLLIPRVIRVSPKGADKRPKLVLVVGTENYDNFSSAHYKVMIPLANDLSSIWGYPKLVKTQLHWIGYMTNHNLIKDENTIVSD